MWTTTHAVPQQFRCPGTFMLSSMPVFSVPAGIEHIVLLLHSIWSASGDTLANELWLLSDKFEKLRMLLAKWGNQKTCCQRELDRVTHWHLQPCGSVVCPSCSFVWGMLDCFSGSSANGTRFQHIQSSWPTFVKTFTPISVSGGMFAE